jgi:transposase
VDIFFSAQCAKESTMQPRRHETHSAAFRQEAVRQARESREPLTRVARDLGVKYSTLRLWVKEGGAASEPASSDSDLSEVRRLRKEVRELRMEREILKKAMAFFAKHSR